MRKQITAVIALVMAAAMPTVAFAADHHVINQDTPNKTGDTSVTFQVDPTYVVTIPADTKIDFNAVSTILGTVKATRMQIEPDKTVNVTATAGALENVADKTKTIPYRLMNGDEEFTFIDLRNTTEKANLTVNITEENWNAAYAGSYQGTITFTVSYADQTND